MYVSEHFWSCPCQMWDRPFLTPGSGATAKLWNVRIDLKRPQKGNFESFLVECVWNVRSKIAKCELLAIFNENKISKFFGVWYLCVLFTQSHFEQLIRKAIQAERLHWCNPGLLWWGSDTGSWGHSGIHQPYHRWTFNKKEMFASNFTLCCMWHHS